MSFVNGTFVFVVIGRTLTVEEFGVIALAITVSSIISLIPGYGFDMFVVREIAQRRTANKNLLILGILVAKGTLSVLAIGGIGLYTAKSTAVTTTAVFWFIGFAAILATFSSFLNSTQKAEENFLPEALTNAMQSLSVMGMLLVGVWFFDLSLYSVGLIILFSRVLSFCVAVLNFAMARAPKSAAVLVVSESAAKRTDVNRDSLQLLWRQAWYATVQAFPFAVQTILGLLYFQVDTVIMGEILPTSQMAYYQASMRLILAVMLLPSILISVFYPRVARELTQIKNKEGLLRDSRLLLETLGAVGSLLTIGFLITAPHIIYVVYGPHMAASTKILQVLSLILVVRMVTGGLGLILIAGHKQHIQILGATVAIVVNIGLNLVLLPRYGVVSAAWVNLFTNWIVFVVYLIFVRRYFGSHVIRPTYSLLTKEATAKTLRLLSAWK